ncbi:uncharacterized protein LOC135492653 [Lineus longissimus]|uniref:uncharacterized protein LOC135492653 n=1 Tax=Lineus longissimus TaxID=88925 RepID=UPI00315CECA4
MVYDPVSKTGGLFTDYINAFLKIKQEASGWPDWCKTEIDRQTYISNYLEHEGIKLDEDAIEYNSGLRALAKLCLCSGWGKIGERPIFVKTEYVSEPSEYFQKMTDDTIEVRDVQMVNDECVLMMTCLKEQFVEANNKTNVVIAAYVTAHGRLKLFSELSKLGKNVLYFDTDSIIYRESSNTSSYRPVLSDFLGHFKDELSGNTITEFVSGGPKNYAYKLKTPERDGVQTVCKVRGFTLNYRNGQSINFDSMKRLILENRFDERIVVRNPRKIKRKKDFKVVSAPESKAYGIVYDKRIITESFQTIPFGYQN